MSDQQLLSINLYALIFKKLQYANPPKMSILRDSFKLHKVLQYNIWTANQVKTECFSPSVGQKSILKIVKLETMANFSVDCQFLKLNLIFNLILALLDHFKRANATQTSIFMKFYSKLIVLFKL